MNTILTKTNKQLLFTITLFVVAFLVLPASHADDASELDIKADAALAKFVKEVEVARQLLDSATAVLVFPTVVQQGFGNDSEYGEGALRIGGKSVAYYETRAESFGLQLGAQKKTVILVFTNELALSEFREKETWVAGVDGTIEIHKPPNYISAVDEAPPSIICFVMDSAGLMYNVSLEGSAFNQISKQTNP